MAHVLIIEDEPLTALDLEEVLERVGAHSFDYADTEDLAIKCATKRRPDLIVSDVNLVKGTGPEAIERITHLIGAIPVIFVTGSPEECRDAPGTVLAKPFVKRDLLAVAEQLLGRSQTKT